MATIKDLAIQIANKTSRYTNLNEAIGANATNIASNVSRLGNIDSQISELQDKTKALRNIKQFDNTQAYSVGDVVESNGLFKVIKEVPENSNIEVTNEEYFTNITGLHNLGEIREITAELDSIKDMVDLIVFDTLELGGNEYPLVMKKSNTSDVDYIDLTLSQGQGGNGFGIIRFFDKTMNCWLYLSDAVKLGYVDETTPIYKIVMSDNPMRKTSRSEGFYLTGNSNWTGDSNWNKQAPNYVGSQYLDIIENKLDNNNLLLEVYANNSEAGGWGVYYQYFLPLIYHEDELANGKLNYQLARSNYSSNNYIKYRLHTNGHNISEIQLLSGTSYENRYTSSVNIRVDEVKSDNTILRTVDRVYTATAWTDRWSIKFINITTFKPNNYTATGNALRTNGDTEIPDYLLDQVEYEYELTCNNIKKSVVTSSKSINIYYYDEFNPGDVVKVKYRYILGNDKSLWSDEISILKTDNKKPLNLLFELSNNGSYGSAVIGRIILYSNDERYYVKSYYEPNFLNCYFVLSKLQPSSITVLNEQPNDGDLDLDEYIVYAKASSQYDGGSGYWKISKVMNDVGILALPYDTPLWQKSTPIGTLELTSDSVPFDKISFVNYQGGSTDASRYSKDVKLYQDDNLIFEAANTINAFEVEI